MHYNPVWGVMGACGGCLIAFREGGLSPTTFTIRPINWQWRGGGDSLSSFGSSRRPITEKVGILLTSERTRIPHSTSL